MKTTIDTKTIEELNEAEILSIIRLRQKGLTLNEIAERHNVTIRIVRLVVKGQ